MSSNANENKDQPNGKTFNINQVGAWIAFVGTLFMFWQFMRDVHKDITDVKERVSILETQYGYDARLNEIEEKLK